VMQQSPSLVITKSLYLVIRISIDFIHPLLHVVETFLISNIIDYNNPMCSTVIRRSYGPKSFLARRIPNLELNRFAIKLQGSNLEINSDSTDVALCVRVIGKAKEKA
jgi:hypothetical protein